MRIMWLDPIGKLEQMFLFLPDSEINLTLTVLAADSKPIL